MNGGTTEWFKYKSQTLNAGKADRKREGVSKEKNKKIFFSGEFPKKKKKIEEMEPSFFRIYLLVIMLLGGGGGVF